MFIKMIPEIGHFALIIALLMAAVQAVMPLAGAATRRPLWMAYGQPMAVGQFVFIAIAYACLTASYMLDDFSVANVANNSNSLLPWYYKFSAVWGNHEGRCCCGALCSRAGGVRPACLPATCRGIWSRE